MSAPASPEVAETVTRIVKEAFGSRCTVGPVEVLGGERSRSAVRRVHLSGGGAPSTVVAKASMASAQDEADDDGQSRFAAEVSALRLLRRLDLSDGAGGLTPVLHGYSVADRVVVMSDLGQWPSLADILQGVVPGNAGQALHRYAASLGELGAATHGRIGELDDIRADLGASAGGSSWRGWVLALGAELRPVLAAFNVRVDDDVLAEVETVAQQICDDPAWRVLTSSDPCPDNTVVRPDGSVAHFDFEFAAARCALVDGAYLSTPFPSCWCLNAIPGGLQEELLRTYRSALAEGVPAALDDERFTGAHVCASAYWFVRSVVWLLPEVRQQDVTWGTSTVRQRLLQRVPAFVRTARAADRLPALAGLADSLHRRLSGTWTGVAPMTTYPGLR